MNKGEFDFSKMYKDAAEYYPDPIIAEMELD